MLKNLLTKFSIVGELLSFFWKEKMWWMIPMIVVLIIPGLLMVFTQRSAVTPFIYTLF